MLWTIVLGLVGCFISGLLYWLLGGLCGLRDLKVDFGRWFEKWGESVGGSIGCKMWGKVGCFVFCFALRFGVELGSAFCFGVLEG